MARSTRNPSAPDISDRRGLPQSPDNNSWHTTLVRSLTGRAHAAFTMPSRSLILFVCATLLPGCARQPVAGQAPSPAGAVATEPRAGPPAAPEPATPPADPVTLSMQEQAEMFVETIRMRRQKGNFDYSLDSLRDVDAWLEWFYAVRPTQRFIDFPSRGTMAYVGETTRRHFNGTWRADEPDEFEARVGLWNIGQVVVDEQVIDPTEWVYDALLKGIPLHPRALRVTGRPEAGPPPPSRS